jgi:hypothetical protein
MIKNILKNQVRVLKRHLELDEQPKPTRKVSHPATPISNKEEPSTHDKRKGRRTIK